MAQEYYRVLLVTDCQKALTNSLVVVTGKEMVWLIDLKPFFCDKKRQVRSIAPYS